MLDLILYTCLIWFITTPCLAVITYSFALWADNMGPSRLKFVSYTMGSLVPIFNWYMLVRFYKEYVL